ncbi:MAG: hypothetical protein EA402_10475 [Planctomycetota bacterium]|nr:MAG: hypothetical protein EA402_10475 [Planctomycetota bacterium]
MSPGLSEAYNLLADAISGDDQALSNLANNPKSTAACELAFTERKIPSVALIEFILKNLSLPAEHVVIDLLFRGSPWTWARFRPNE